MPAIAIPTPFNISIDLNVAPFWKRIVAFLIDMLILFVYWVAVHYLVLNNIDDQGLSLALNILLIGLPVTLYHFLMEVFFSGQSIGKKAMGIRVVNFTGNEASVSQYFLRMLFRATWLAPLVAMVIASLFSQVSSENQNGFYIIAVLIYLMANLAMFLYFILNNYGQRIGDKLANTLVIETYTAADIHQTIFQDIADHDYQVRYPQVMQLSDRDINGIRNMLDIKRITRESEAYMDRIAGRIEKVLNIQRDQDSYDFLAQLLRDYNYLTSK
jgi:uncharacterized RDD family membrane protein YckC